MSLVLHWQQWFTLVGFFIGIASQYTVGKAAIISVPIIVLGQYVLWSGGWYTGGIAP